MYSSMYECSKDVFHIRKKFGVTAYGWNDLGGSQFWTSTAGGELGFTLSDCEEFLGLAFHFCSSCCTLKYELWMMHLFHVEGCPRLLSNFLFFFDVNESRHRPGVIIRSWESNFSHWPYQLRWLSLKWKGFCIEIVWSVFTSFQIFSWFFPWGGNILERLHDRKRLISQRLIFILVSN